MSSLDEQDSEEKDITPYILPFFSQVTKDNRISKLQIKNLTQNKDVNFTFNIKGWNEFIKNLNFCLEHKVSLKDNKTIKCIEYWKENILKANQVSDDSINSAEEFYQKNPTNTFGITEDNYKYLVGLINEYDKN